MNSKQWAVFFVAILSLDYATATFFGGYKVPKEKDGYYGWSNGCRCNEHITGKLDVTLKSVQSSLGGRYRNGCPLKDSTLEEYEFKKGHVQGLQKFERRGDYRCSLSSDYVRVFFQIGFVELVINYYVSLVEEILTGFLGGIGSLIGNILGSISNLLFRCALTDVYGTVILYQSFGSGNGFQIEGFYLNNIQKISFLSKKFKSHEDSFGPYFRPVCDHALQSVFQSKIRVVFESYFRRITVKKEYFYYESSSQEESSGYSSSYSEGDSNEDNDD